MLGTTDPTRPFDVRRMFVGDEPPLFLVEVAFRTVFIFAFTLVLLRIVGKRAVGQLSLFEVTIIIGLGSAVGDPMFQPDVPLSHAMVVITLVVSMYRLVIVLVNRSPKFESFVEGKTACLVKEGRIDVARLRSEHYGREEMFEMLRRAGITQLGEVKVAYLEQSGTLAVFARPPAEVELGLPLVPPWDVVPPEQFEAEAPARPATYACMGCGALHVQPDEVRPLPACGCASREWTRARRDPLGAGELRTS